MDQISQEAALLDDAVPNAGATRTLEGGVILPELPMSRLSTPLYEPVSAPLDSDGAFRQFRPVRPRAQAETATPESETKSRHPLKDEPPSPTARGGQGRGTAASLPLSQATGMNPVSSSLAATSPSLVQSAQTSRLDIRI